MTKHRPFDPSRSRAARVARKAPPPAEGTITVRQVNELVRNAIARNVPDTLHVLGEIGDLSRPASGHLYLTLKDRDSELRCVMWRSSAARLKFKPEVGMEVIATGGIDVYAPRGSYQLIARKLEPRGVGALEIAFRQLKQRLEREGLFDRDRRKPLPTVPQRVALVTSPSGAALRDILQTLARRFPALDVLLFPVRVQGEGAADEIAGAIRLLNAKAAALGGIDVAIVGRGGGSLEDLWAFNEEVVARAIVASRVPIVSAVGHEVDVSISDLVADLRAPTPTAAAELIAPRMADLIDGLEQGSTRASRAVRHALELAQARLDTTRAYDGLARPLARLRESSQRIDENRQRLRHAFAGLVGERRERLHRADLAILRFGTGAGFARVSERLASMVYHLDRMLGRILRGHERHVADRATKIAVALPRSALARFDERLRQSRERLAGLMQSGLTLQRRMLEARIDAVAARDPRRVLQRGFSITRDAKTRRVIRSVDQVRDRMRIITQVSDGEFRGTADDPRQPGLFDDA